MTEEIVVAVLALALAYYVAAPLRRGPRADVDRRSVLQDEAEQRKRTALGAIVDIEGERAVGKLSERDFEALRREYEAEALAALRELDALRSSPRDDDELEDEIAALRAEMACPACGGIRTPEGVCPRCSADR
ncbi:MAG TPA: hypothetical protein VHJ34_11925 [Actinomycetota bacterium]|nr:hypothetical protein [Actinomycetota bacterium]